MEQLVLFAKKASYGRTYEMLLDQFHAAVGGQQEDMFKKVASQITQLESERYDYDLDQSPESRLSATVRELNEAVSFFAG